MTTIESGNLLAPVVSGAAEHIQTLIASNGVRIERIVSTGQASPPGFWYDQSAAEFVLVVAGSAGLRFEHEAAARRLKPGDWVGIPAHCRHRIDWTDATTPTIWLAVHYRSTDT